MSRSCFRARRAGSVVWTFSAVFWTRIMRCARRSVETVSSRCADSAHMHAKSSVAQFPPSESFRTPVSFVWR